MKLTDEPTMDTIDDYNNNETPEKRKTIYLIIGVLVLIAIVSFVLLSFNTVTPDDYVGTTEEPGIVSTKVF
jgi:hypothetical protein